MSAPVSRMDAASPYTTLQIVVERVSTPAQQVAMLGIRRRVFGVEQGVGDLCASDPDDARSLIALASFPSDDGNGDSRPIATGRLTLAPIASGSALIAWVATMPEARGLGAGTAVMRFLLDAADRAGAFEALLAAQAHAEGFYRRLGFARAGPLYDVRGIHHRRMVRRRPT